jgi:hypothetical protein
MAGEWIAIDCNLYEKPEVQELIDITGESVEVVCYRLYRLWGWASLNSPDGIVRTTPSRLARLIGGTDAFWLAVELVGWIRFDQAAGTAEVPGWGRRFSQAAKARACHADRQSRYRDGRVTVERHESATRGEERTVSTTTTAKASRKGEQKPEPEPEPGQEVPTGSWEALRDAWNAGTGPKWRSPRPPAVAAARLSQPGWLETALAGIGHLPQAKYFSEPVALDQFCGIGFVDRLLGGKYDRPKKPPASSGRPPGGRYDPDKPEPRPFAGKAADDFEFTKAKAEALAALKAAGGAA